MMFFTFDLRLSRPLWCREGGLAQDLGNLVNWLTQTLDQENCVSRDLKIQIYKVVRLCYSVLILHQRVSCEHNQRNYQSNPVCICGDKEIEGKVNVKGQGLNDKANTIARWHSLNVTS